MIKFFSGISYIGNTVINTRYDSRRYGWEGEVISEDHHKVYVRYSKYNTTQSYKRNYWQALDILSTESEYETLIGENAQLKNKVSSLSSKITELSKLCKTYKVQHKELAIAASCNIWLGIAFFLTVIGMVFL